MKNVLLTLLVTLLIVGCTAPVEPPVAIPVADEECPSEMDWNGLVPGRSTESDVIAALGTPQAIGEIQRGQSGEITLQYYEYPVQEGRFTEISHSVYFREGNPTVYFIEAIVADVDGKFHPLQETVDVLGKEVDAVYINYAGNDVEFRGGPDILVVWAECGVALDVVGGCAAGSYDYLECHTPSTWIDASTPTTNTVTVAAAELMPVPTRAMRSLHTNHGIFVQVLFPPTTFEGYKTLFAPVITYYGVDYGRLRD